MVVFRGRCYSFFSNEVPQIYNLELILWCQRTICNDVPGTALPAICTSTDFVVVFVKWNTRSPSYGFTYGVLSQLDKVLLCKCSFSDDRRHLREALSFGVANTANAILYDCNHSGNMCFEKASNTREYWNYRYGRLTLLRMQITLHRAVTQWEIPFKWLEDYKYIYEITILLTFPIRAQKILAFPPVPSRPLTLTFW